jgi:Tol biopolymer transport system component
LGTKNSIFYWLNDLTLADRSEKKVVLWNGANLTKEKLFTMEGSVQTLSFNPITAQLFVGTTSDIGIYNPESDKKPLEKKSVKNAMKSSSWSPDGRFIAYASVGGAVHIKDSKFNKKVLFLLILELFYVQKTLNDKPNPRPLSKN